jgi:hypothetical protein
MVPQAVAVLEYMVLVLAALVAQVPERLHLIRYQLVAEVDKVDNQDLTETLILVDLVVMAASMAVLVGVLLRLQVFQVKVPSAQCVLFGVAGEHTLAPEPQIHLIQ